MYENADSLDIGSMLSTKSNKKRVILQQEESAQALEQLTDEEFEKRERRSQQGFLRKLPRQIYHKSYMFVVPTLIGAGIGATSGDAQSGALYGLTLGTTLNVLLRIGAAVKQGKPRAEMTEVEKKKNVLKDHVRSISIADLPISSLLGVTAFSTAVYFGGSLLVDVIAPTDNIFDVVKVDNGLAARIGAVHGVITGYQIIRDSKKIYRRLEQTISGIRNRGFRDSNEPYIEGQYRVVDEEPPTKRDLGPHNTLPPGR